MDSLVESPSSNGSKLLGSGEVLSPGSLNLQQHHMYTTPTPASSPFSPPLKSLTSISPAECHRTSKNIQVFTCPETPIKNTKPPRHIPIPTAFPKTPPKIAQNAITSLRSSPFTDSLSKSVKSSYNRALRSGKSSITASISNPFLTSPFRNSPNNDLIGAETPVLSCKTPKSTPMSTPSKSNISGEEEQQTPSGKKRLLQGQTDFACSPNVSMPCSPFCGSAKSSNIKL